MIIGIPKESLAGETRVACTPATVTQLQKLGFEVVVESGAGLAAGLVDAAYEAAGATVAKTVDVWKSPLIYKVNAPSANELRRLKAGQTLVSFLWPAQNPDLVQKLADKKVIRIRMFFHRKDFSCDYSFDSFSRTDNMLYRDAVHCQRFRHIIRIHSFYIY